MDPEAAEDHPVFISFDFSSAFASLNRTYLSKVLERFKIPLGYRHAIAGLYSHMVGYVKVGGKRVSEIPILSGVAQGCPLSGTLWALGLDPFLRLLSRELPTRQPGSLGACADDIGTVLRAVKTIRVLAPHFLQLQKVAALSLQAV